LIRPLRVFDKMKVASTTPMQAPISMAIQIDIYIPHISCA